MGLLTVIRTEDFRDVFKINKNTYQKKRNK